MFAKYLNLLISHSNSEPKKVWSSISYELVYQTWLKDNISSLLADIFYVWENCTNCNCDEVTDPVSQDSLKSKTTMGLYAWSV